MSHHQVTSPQNARQSARKPSEHAFEALLGRIGFHEQRGLQDAPSNELAQLRALEVKLHQLSRGDPDDWSAFQSSQARGFELMQCAHLSADTVKHAKIENIARTVWCAYKQHFLSPVEDFEARPSASPSEPGEQIRLIEVSLHEAGKPGAYCFSLVLQDNQQQDLRPLASDMANMWELALRSEFNPVAVSVNLIPTQADVLFEEVPDDLDQYPEELLAPGELEEEEEGDEDVAPCDRYLFYELCVSLELSEDWLKQNT